MNEVLAKLYKMSVRIVMMISLKGFTGAHDNSRADFVHFGESVLRPTCNTVNQNRHVIGSPDRQVKLEQSAIQFNRFILKAQTTSITEKQDKLYKISIN